MNHSFHFNYNYNTRYELETTQDQSQQTHFNYQYDLTGNRTTSNEEGNQSTYTPHTQASCLGAFGRGIRFASSRMDNLNQYQQVNNQTYQYDNNGNLTNDGINTYFYDFENRLITAGSVNFKYDPFGRRIAKTISNTATLYVHDQDNTIETYSCNSSLQNCSISQSFIYSNRIDEPLLLTNHGTQSQDYYYHHDALGNTIALTKTDGTFQETYQYDPYGKPHFFDSDGASIPNSTVNNPYLFTGREWDSETGLYYLRARFYSPELGRFLQRDPINISFLKLLEQKSLTNSVIFKIKLTNGFIYDPQNLHSYLYIQNNPINYKDPLGLTLDEDLLQDLLLSSGMAIVVVGIGVGSSAIVIVGGGIAGVGGILYFYGLARTPAEIDRMVKLVYEQSGAKEHMDEIEKVGKELSCSIRR